MAQNVKELKLISLLKSKVRLVFFKEEEEKNQLAWANKDLCLIRLTLAEILRSNGS